MANNHDSRAICVYNKTRETFVATEATVADSYVRRLVGLLGKTKRWARLGVGLWIVPSQGVHTIGMMFPIDLVFLSKDKEVVHLEEHRAALSHLRPFPACDERAGASSPHHLSNGNKSGGPAGYSRLNGAH